VNSALLEAMSYDQVLQILIDALIAALEAQGFIPRTSSGGITGSVALGEAPAEGTETNLNPQAVDLGIFPPVAPSLTWPEGNPRLVYPVVD